MMASQQLSDVSSKCHVKDYMTMAFSVNNQLVVKPIN